MSLIVLALGAAGVWATLLIDTQAAPLQLEVSFLDVGQGDAILIEAPSGAQVLVDGGASGAVLRELAAELPLLDDDLDLVVATHPDTDHVGGLVDVLERYTVGQILLTENEGESDAAQAFARAAEAEEADITMARRGQVWRLDASTTLEVLFPETDVSEMESNASSVVLKLSYGTHDFLLTGDAPKRMEEYLVLAFGEHLESEVLKVGHHGSRTSTAEPFLAAVDPDYAVISAGADNRYGHPHVEITDALFNAGVTVLETAASGTVTFISDGATLRVR